MISTPDLESALVGALIAQSGSAMATACLQDLEPSVLSGYVPRRAVATLADLVLERGMGLTPQEARLRVRQAVSDNEEAVIWVDTLDPQAGAAANPEKLARQLSRLAAARDAEALFATCTVDPDRLDEDLAGILSRGAEILSRVTDDRWKVETLTPYMQQYARGEAVIPPENADSIVVFGHPDMDDPEEGIIASRGTLGVIAAPPTWGKSVEVSQIAAATGMAGRWILAASLEQNRQQVAMRAIASLVGAFKNCVKRGGQTRHVDAEVVQAADRIQLLSPGSCTPWFRLEAAARRLHRRGRLDVLVVDYFTLLEPPSLGKQASSAAAYGWISKAAKRLAQELGIAVILVAQFNRGGTQAFDQEPEMKDLKETGQLEQDADWMLFLWAPSKGLGLAPQHHADNRVSCWKKAKNRWGKVDFPGNPRFCELDVARDRVLTYVRSTEDAAVVGGSHDRF